MTHRDFTQTELSTENERVLRQQLKARRLRLKTSNDLNTRVFELLGQANATFCRPSESDLTFNNSHKQTLWRIIKQRKSIGIAATTALVMVGGWILLFLPQSNHNNVWADMLETMKGMDWIQIRVDMELPPELPEETVRSFEDSTMSHGWLRFEPAVVITHERNGVIEFADLDQNVRYAYLPTSNEVTIDSHTERYDPALPNSPLGMVEYWLDMLEGSDDPENPKLSFHTEHDVYEGREVERIQLNHDGFDITALRDVEQNLLVKIFITVQPSPEEEAIVKIVVHLSYPESGPIDIFTAGAPADAEIRDNRSEENVITAMMRAIQANYDHNYGNRICVITRSKSYGGERTGREQLTISRKQKNLYRSDTYLLHPLVGEEDEAKGAWPDLTLQQSLQIEQSDGYGPSSHVFDGQFVYQGKPAKKSPAEMFFPASGPEAAYSYSDISSLAWVKLFDLGVNNARINETITKLPANREYPELVGFRIHFDVQERWSMDHEFWIDPQKSNLVMRYTSRQVKSLAGGNGQTFEKERHVLEAAQTANKQWYPRHIEITERYPGRNGTAHQDIEDIRILIDTDWTTSDPIFTKDYLFNKPQHLN